jgi:DMSO/TMAO reductase YedYZ molybdopterin-dependent catalytic subunit
MTDTPAVTDRIPVDLASVAVALAAGVAGVLGSYGTAGFTPAFVAGPVSSLLAKRMPGFMITFAITVLGDLGEKLNLLTAVVIAVVLFAVPVLLWLRVGREYGVGGLAALGSGLSVWLLTAIVTGGPVSALGAGAGVAAVVGVSELARSSRRVVDVEPEGRRRVLAAVAAAVGTSVLGYFVGKRTTATSTALATSAPSGEPYENSEEPDFELSEMRTLAEERSFEVGEMEPLLSENFFTVDINSVPPSVDAEEWSLSVTGEVEQELEFSFDDIREMEMEHRFVTLRCVGERLNGKKMDTAIWSGVAVEGMIERASPSGDCDCVMLRGVDGYEVQFPIEALRPGLLAISMNGASLPRPHGAPLRALVPGHWGEVNAKWLSEMEFLQSEQDGYWERKGWHGTGPVNTVAKLHGTEKRDGQLVVGGHAYAGTRGIEQVEVSTDGGDTWNVATLTDPLPGDDVWRQWKYSYDPPEAGTHEVVVRATDGTGRLQPQEEESPYPNGASGWVSESIDPGRI